MQGQLCETNLSDGKKNQDYKRKRLLSKKRLFFYAFSLLAFFFGTYYFSEIRKDFRLLRNFNGYWLLLAFVLQLLTYLLTAYIYRSLAKMYPAPHLPSLKEWYKASVISLFFNQTVPSAGISGNSFLFSYLERKKLSSASIISLILLDLLTFYAAMDSIIVLFIAISIWKKWPQVFHGILSAGFAIYLLFGITMMLAGRKKAFDLLYKKLGTRKLFKAFFQKVRSGFESKDLAQNPIELTRLLKKHPLSLSRAFFFQLLLFATDVLTLVALFNGLGVTVPILFVAVSLICTKIISLLPFSPGSLILYEGSMSFFFVKLGVVLGTSVMVTLIFRLLSFWLPIPAGLFLYRQWLGRKLGNDKHYHGS